MTQRFHRRLLATLILPLGLATGVALAQGTSSSSTSGSKSPTVRTDPGSPDNLESKPGPGTLNGSSGTGMMQAPAGSTGGATSGSTTGSTTNGIPGRTSNDPSTTSTGTTTTTTTPQGNATQTGTGATGSTSTPAADSQARRIFDQLDTNHDGTLSFEEFSRATIRQSQ